MPSINTQFRLQRICNQVHPVGTSSSGTNTQVFIASIPKGPLDVRNFKIEKTAAPVPKDGEVLVQTLAITIGAGQRAGLQGSASYAGAAQENVLMNGTGIGRVINSRHADYSPGDLVFGSIGWQEQAALPANSVTKVKTGIDVETQLGALGINGLTAYFGLLDVGAPNAGETVVVSAAAGSVGHLVGQIAKIKGCRVVGVAGSDEKCAALVSELGFDAAVNYKSPSFREDFKAATPRRIDIFFDNTGGETLNSALFRMNRKGRIVCCGNVSAYDTDKPASGPRGVPGLLVNNEVRMQGFLVFSYAEQYAEARAQLAEWARLGKLKPKTTVYEGLSQAPQAFVDLLHGLNQGTTIVHVAD